MEKQPLASSESASGAAGLSPSQLPRGFALRQRQAHSVPPRPLCVRACSTRCREVSCRCSDASGTPTSCQLLRHEAATSYGDAFLSGVTQHDGVP